MTEIIIAGATASGKSALAVSVATVLNGEIVSADSMQIYQKMNIGTAKITPTEQRGILHHCIDIVSPSVDFSVAEYVECAEKAIKDIHIKEKSVIISGGTGLYLRSLVYPMDLGNTAKNPALRAELWKEYEDNGANFLYEKLKKFSPEKATAIHPNNVKRVIRALELLEDGQTEFSKFEDLTPRRDVLYFYIDQPREKLYDRINRRVDCMIAEGLRDEVFSLLNSGEVNFSSQSMQAIGYKEWKPYFDGSLSIEAVADKIKQNSRNYAKRQITWFKKENVIVLNGEKSNGELTDIIVNYYKNNAKS